jgi:ADP-ribosyl-[dinitrogen reductase] hydrolase
MAAWGATAILTLMQPHELEQLGLASLRTETKRRGMAWHHWPIPDYGLPDAPFAAAWPERSATLRHRLSTGSRVLVHCRAGPGRSGTIVARLPVEHGAPADEAIRTVRITRPGAIETAGQEAWVRSGPLPPLPAARNC